MIFRIDAEIDIVVFRQKLLTFLHSALGNKTFYLLWILGWMKNKLLILSLYSWAIVKPNILVVLLLWILDLMKNKLLILNLYSWAIGKPNILVVLLLWILDIMKNKLLILNFYSWALGKQHFSGRSRNAVKCQKKWSLHLLRKCPHHKKHVFLDFMP